jgi:hypothetical protein
MRGHVVDGASSGCGSRISISALQARIRWRHLRRLALARDRLGRARAAQSERTDAYGDASTTSGRAASFRVLLHAGDIAQSLTAPHGDAATSYPGTCNLPDDPMRRAFLPTAGA